MQEWLGKWHILRRQNKIDLLSQCHRVVWFKRMDHMRDAGVTNSECLKLWEELVGWLLCVLRGYDKCHWSSEEFPELEQICCDACGLTGILERCHTVLAAMWVMDKCWLSNAIHPYQWDIDIFHQDAKRTMGAYDPRKRTVS